MIRAIHFPDNMMPEYKELIQALAMMVIATEQDEDFPGREAYLNAFARPRAIEALQNAGVML